MCASEAIVGIYDEERSTAYRISQLSEKGRELLCMPFSAGEEGVPADYHTANKQLLLERATHIVVVVTSVPSISILTGALRRLIDGRLAGLYAISENGIDPLLRATPVEEEIDAMTRFLKEGRLINSRTFDETTYLSWLSNCR